MKIKFLGAAGEVTGSCYVLDMGRESLMIDCGMFQGKGSEDKNIAELDWDVAGLTGVVLTHAHLDHCGRLPLLVNRGFKGKVYMNQATADLVKIVLLDSAKIAQGNEKREGTPAMYTEVEVNKLLSQVEVVDYDKEVRVGNSFVVKWLDAGHILGSSSLEIKAGGKRLVFSGDLGNEPSPIVRKIERVERAEVVVLESTYGNRLHKGRGEEMALLADLCNEVDKSGGTFLLPAFSLERTQELLHMISHLKSEGRVSGKLPVFLDSPMAIRATAVFEKHSDLFNKKLQEHFKKQDPFDFEGLVLVKDSKMSRRIGGQEGSKLIIAGSGMMSGGRIVGHAKRWLSNPRTILLLTGFQAIGTLGRKMQEGAKEIVIDGKRVQMNARIEEITTMSAHADQGLLMSWLLDIEGVKKVILTHGEEEGRSGLEVKIKEKMNRVRVNKPLLHDELEV